MASNTWPRAECECCVAFRELILEGLGRGRNAVAIWQDLVDGHGFRARYANVGISQRSASYLRSRIIRAAGRWAKRNRMACWLASISSFPENP
jgi:hypothetical protein